MTIDSAREAAERWLAEALMNAYNETVGGKLDEYIDGQHFIRCARIAADFAEKGMLAVREDAAKTARNYGMAAWSGYESKSREIAEMISAHPLPWAEAMKEGGE
jgi:hypothetical protein